MTIDERLDRLERACGAQDELVRELREAAFVTAQMEARQSRAIKEHSEWLAEYERSMAEHNMRMKELDRRIGDLVSGVGEFMRRERPSA